MPFSLAKSDKHSKDEKETPKDADKKIKDADAAGIDPPATDDQAEEETPQRAPVFRPTFLDEETPGPRAAATETATPPPEGDIFFVSVTRDGGAETHRFGNATEVQTFVEELLEADVPQEDVTAFSGRRLALKIRHRPVVKLFANQEK